LIFVCASLRAKVQLEYVFSQSLSGYVKQLHDILSAALEPFTLAVLADKQTISGRSKL